jgi:hypothetical protein
MGSPKYRRLRSATVTRSESTEEPPFAEQANRLMGQAALRLHLTLAAGLALCIGAFCFEIIRALGGNTLSWVYVFEWPFFAGFGIYMWWKLFNGWDRGLPSSTRDGGTTGVDANGAAGTDDEQDEALMAWKRYLSERREAEAQEQEL